MNKKIAGEFAIGVILLLAITLGGIVWLQNEKQELLSQNNANFENVKTSEAKPRGEIREVVKADEKTQPCTPHYYEGEAQLKGWLVPSENKEDKSLIMQIASEDVASLPTKDTPKDANNFLVKLIDASEQIKSELASATKENPATITVRGYGEICQQPPLVSLEQAKVAFKKS